MINVLSYPETHSPIADVQGNVVRVSLVSILPLVKVKEKFQVTLPASFREKAGVEVGDLLEAKVEGKKITLVPKSMVDRDIEVSLREFREGKGYGPFKSAKEAVRFLRRV